jgi:hypothetical protein
MPLDSRVISSIAGTLTATPAAVPLGTAVTPKVDTTSYTDLAFANGTALGQADVLYQATTTLAAAGFVDIDLSGALLNALGGAAVFARVKSLKITANGLPGVPNVNNVVVGAAATNAWNTLFSTTGTVTLKPGGFCHFGAAEAIGWPVTAGTGDLLRVTNGGAGTAVSFDIVVLGCSV